jgi:hypothetical protein
MKKYQSTTLAILYVIGISLYTSSAIAEPGTIVSSASLRQSASYTAPVIGQLEAGQAVQLGQRTGGWKLVTFSVENGSTNSGWVRSYQVRTGTITVKQESSSGGFLSGLASLSRKASGLFSSNDDQGRRSGDSVATIGVRGLSEEEIKNAKPDFKELEKMEKYRVSTKTAVDYAHKGQRKSIKLAHMPKSQVEE